MRDLKNFSIREWFRWKPLDHFMIQICNDGLQRFFRICHTRPLKRFLQEAEHLRGGNIGLVIAYEQPWALDWLLRMAARNLTGGKLLIFDNSRRAQARTDIKMVCQEHYVPYLALPPNPTRHANRSHGMAMTWVFYNVVRAIKPRTFSYIDHDLIPIRRTSLGKDFGDQPFYGLPNVSKWAWSLWAGYCSYEFREVQSLPLNFLNDFSIGLDTGGRNWMCLYKKFDRFRLNFAAYQDTEVMDPLDGTPSKLSILDDNWLHLGGAGYSSGFRERANFYERILCALEECGTL
jgi:hypothetical protein